MKLTAGTLLDGKVRYDQPEAGYRTGLEPVLLAASLPAKPGENVLEAGCGAGAGLLCLAARVAGVFGVGVERDPALASLAAHNFAANRFGGLRAETADITLWRGDAPFHHAFANPPWHDPAGTASPSPGRRAAKRAHPGLIETWVSGMANNLLPRGTLSLILPSGSLPEALHAMQAAQCGGVTIIPLWPRAGTPAKMLILRATRLGRGKARLLPGLILHEAAGFSAAATNILRGGCGLDAG